MDSQSDNYTSETIEYFVEFAKASVEAIEQAQIDLSEAELEIIDIEHYIELVRCDAVTRQKVYNKLKTARIKRRNAKETIELYSPIAKWWQKGGSVKELLSPEVLGAVKATEFHQVKRRYRLRTHILDDVVKGDII